MLSTSTHLYHVIALSHVNTGCAIEADKSYFINSHPNTNAYSDSQAHSVNSVSTPLCIGLPSEALRCLSHRTLASGRPGNTYHPTAGATSMLQSPQKAVMALFYYAHTHRDRWEELIPDEQSDYQLILPCTVAVWCQALLCSRP